MAEEPVIIPVSVTTGNSVAEIKRLQAAISSFHSGMAGAGKAASNELANMQQNLVNNINALGGGNSFASRIVKVRSETEAFTRSLERNDFTMRQLFRNAAGATGMFGNAFKKEFDIIDNVARSRVRTLQTQFVNLGRDSSGAMRAIQIRPLSLDMNNLGTQTQVAAQKIQLFNENAKQASTQLLNWGKNTQWAGRQLMVGFTLPLAMMGAAAARSFMELEKQTISFKRVYGDLNTTVEQTNKAADEVKNLATNFTQYGVAFSDTMALAAKAAAMGKTGADLMSQVSETTRLSVLGQVDQQQALETTISLTNAFGVTADELAGKIDFLNAVENQTVTSIEDLTTSIPKAGPVIKQMGGSVEDLAFFLTAMREGGINASEGANALKSGIAALINPTKTASDMLAGYGINVQKMVEADKGDVKQLVIDFASALDKLDPLQRAKAIEQMFGKFQFSRISTLFQNVISQGSQAQKVLELTNASTEQLAALSKKELDKVAESTTYKYEKAVADFQVAIAPVGEQFLKAIIPLIEFGTKILNMFNSWSDGAKSFAANLTIYILGAVPVIVMMIGLIANFSSFVGNLFRKITVFFMKLTSGVNEASGGIRYMTQTELEAEAMAGSLDQAHAKLTQRFDIQNEHMQALIATYDKLIAAQSRLGTTTGSALLPGGVAGGAMGGTPKRHNASSAGETRIYKDQLAQENAQNYKPKLGAAITAGQLAMTGAGADAATQYLLGRGWTQEQIDQKKLTQLDRSHIAKVDKSIKDRRLWSTTVTTPELQILNNQIANNFAQSKQNRVALASKMGNGKQSQAILQKLENGITLTQKEWMQVAPALEKIQAEVDKGKASTIKVTKSWQNYAGAAAAAIRAQDKALSELPKNVIAKIANLPYAEAQKEVDRIQAEYGRTSKQSKPSGTKAPVAPIKTPKAYAASQKKAEQSWLAMTKEEQKLYRSKGAFVAVETAKFEEERKSARREADARRKASQATTKTPKLTMKQRAVGAVKGAGRFMGGMGGMGVGMGLQAGAMFAGMAGNEGLASGLNMAGNVAMGISGIAMAFQAISSVLPAIQAGFITFAGALGGLALPLTAIVGIIGVFAYATWQANENIKKAGISANDAALKFGASADSMRQIAEEQGKTLATDAMSGKISESISSLTATGKVDTAAGSEFLSTESGKKLSEEVKAQIDKGASESSIGELIGQKLALAIVNGLLDKSAAQGVATSLGDQYGSVIGMSINKSLSTITNSENGTVQGLVEQQLADVTESFAILSDKTTKEVVTQSQTGGTETEIVPTYSDLEKRAAAGTAIGQLANARASQNQGLAMLDQEWQKRKDILAQEGDMAKLEKERRDYEAERTSLLEANQKSYSDSLAEINKLTAEDKQEATYAGTDTILANTVGTAQEKSAQTSVNSILGMTDKTVAITATVALQSGSLSYDTFNSLIDTVGKDSPSISKILELDVKLGAGNTDLVAQLAPVIGTSGTNNLTRYLTIASKVDGQAALDEIMNILNDPSLNGEEKMAKITFLAENTGVLGLINRFNRNPPKTEKEFNAIFASYGFDVVEGQWKYFDSLPKYLKKTYITEYVTAYKTLKGGTTTGRTGGTRTIDGGQKAQGGKKPPTPEEIAHNNAKAAAQEKEDRRQARLDRQNEKLGGGTGTPKAPSGGGGGGGGGKGGKAGRDSGGSDSGSSDTAATPKDPKGDALKKKQDYVQKQLDVISAKEKRINDVYARRKEALQKIADLQKSITQQQRDQLDLANALSSGDIAAAAKAAQQLKANAAQRAIDMQQKAIDTAQQNQLKAITVDGLTREQLELKLDDLALQIAEHELSMIKKERPARPELGVSHTLTQEEKDARRAANQARKAKRKGNISEVVTASMGGMIKHFASGGFTSLGTDTIPAMLTPGEFVVRRPAAQSFGIKNLESINNGSYQNGSVYNYDVSVNVSSNSNPDEIARVVVQQIKNTDSYHVRGNRI